MTTFNGQTYFDLDAGERARDVALAAVGGSDWIERATAVVRLELAGQEVLAEEFRRVCEARGVTPEHGDRPAGKEPEPAESCEETAGVESHMSKRLESRMAAIERRLEAVEAQLWDDENIPVELTEKGKAVLELLSLVRDAEKPSDDTDSAG